MEVLWETVPPLRNGIVEAVAFTAFCAVCLNPAYHQLDHGIWKQYLFIYLLAKGTLKWSLLLVPKWP